MRQRVVKIGLILAGILGGLCLLPLTQSIFYGAKAAWGFKEAAPLVQNYTLAPLLHSSAEGSDQTIVQHTFDQALGDFQKFNQKAESSWIWRQFLSRPLQQIQQAEIILESAQRLMTGQHRYALLFQNTDEIRATGGFIGSFATLELDEGQISTFDIQDIYVPDGQFAGFIQAPPGADEYLSGGDSLKLRDANWDADFPTSAQRVLNYLSWGKEVGYAGAIAINSNVIPTLLSVTGPIEIKDYDQTVTANNFAEIARAERDQFFAGSQQKQHFLSVFFKQLLAELNQLNNDQLQDLIKKMLHHIESKDLQFYSQDEILQSQWRNLNITGELEKQTDTTTLMIVESNVGINKANQQIKRAATIENLSSQLNIQLNYTNHNQYSPPKNPVPDQAEHLHYIDYLRVITDPELSVAQIKIDDQVLSEWNENIISNSAGEEFKEIGFLTTTKELSTSTITILLNSPQPINQINFIPQSGVSWENFNLR